MMNGALPAMRRAARSGLILSLATCLACTGWHPGERELPIVTTPWQTRCAESLRRAAADAAVQQFLLAGARIDVHSWPGDNFTDHTVSLRAGPAGAITLDLTQHEPAIPRPASDGWHRDAATGRVVWTRSTPFTRASLVVPESPEGASAVPALVHAANHCLRGADGP